MMLVSEQTHVLTVVPVLILTTVTNVNVSETSSERTAIWIEMVSAKTITWLIITSYDCDNVTFIFQTWTLVTETIAHLIPTVLSMNQKPKVSDVNATLTTLETNAELVSIYRLLVIVYDSFINMVI